MTHPALLNIYLHTSKTGPCGWHICLVIKAGRKWARLLCTENAEAFTVPLAELKQGKPLQLKPSRVARRLRLVAKTFGAEGSPAVRDALRLLKTKKEKSE